jgi:hypothetical protein
VIVCVSVQVYPEKTETLVFCSGSWKQKCLFCVQGAGSRNACAVFRELEAETEMVLGWWEKHGGLPRSRITSIRRVQNQPLWTKYALKRAEIQASTP